MKGNKLQNLKGDIKSFEPEDDSEKATKSESAGSKPIPQQIVPVSTKLKAGVVIMILSLCALLGLAGLGIVDMRDHKSALQKEMDDIRTEVTDLRGLIRTNTKENLIHLKILVLDPKVPNKTARQIAAAVQKYARVYSREPDLILSIMRVESRFDPEAISKMGAIGLMQVMPQWINVLGIQCDLMDPDCNTKYGLQILGAYEHLYGDLEMALTAYNRGPGPVDSALMRGKNPDNGYPGKVRTVYDRLRAMSEGY